MLCTLFFAALSLVTLRAQAPLSLEEAMQLAEKHSYVLAADASKVGALKAKIEQAQAGLLPQVSVALNYSRLSDNITPFTVNFGSFTQTLNPQILNQWSSRASAQQVLFAGFKNQNTIAVSKLMAQAAELDVLKDKQEVKAVAANAWFGILRLENTLEALSENQKVMQNRVTDVQNLENKGMALPNDVMKAELALATLENAIAETAQALDVSKYTLKLLTDLPAEQNIVLDKKSLQANMVPSTVSDFQEQALKTRAELLAADVRLTAAEKQIKIAESALYPVVSVGANYYYNNPNARSFPQEERFIGTWDLGVGVSYNLTGAYTAKRQVSEAEANIAQQKAMKSQAEMGIKTEVYAAQAAWMTAGRKIALNQKSVLQATENQKVMQNKFKQQVATLTELLDADFALLQAKINESNAQLEESNTWFKLQKAVGKL